MIKLALMFSILFHPFVGEEKIVQYKIPYSYYDLTEDIEKIQKKYRGNIQVTSIGKSTLGNDLFAIKLGSGKQNIVFIGAHHAREWMTTFLLMNMLEQYADAYSKHTNIGPFDSNVFHEVSIWFIPQINPDGVMLQQGGLHFLSFVWKSYAIYLNDGSTDFTTWKANAIGIDLNRQYPAGWNEVPSRERPGPKNYKGTKPFQALEVKKLVDFIEETQPIMAVSYHSTGRVIYWNYGQNQNVKRDYSIAKKLAQLTSYKLADPPQESYGAGFTDWFIDHYGRPAFTIEIGTFKKELPPSFHEIYEEWRRNQYVGIYLANEAKYFQ